MDTIVNILGGNPGGRSKYFFNNEATIKKLKQAAKDGNLMVYQAIIENVADKNPKYYYFSTPFHLAARNGHVNVCSYISDYLGKNS